MSYIKDTLKPDEKIVYRATTSKIAYINALISLAVMMHPFAMIKLARTELALTDKRVIGKSGGKTIKLAHAEIESVSVRHGPLGWMLDYGTVIINAKDGTSVKFTGIVWPLIFQQEVDEAVEVAMLGRKLSDYAPPV